MRRKWLIRNDQDQVIVSRAFTHWGIRRKFNRLLDGYTNYGNGDIKKLPYWIYRKL